MGKDSVHHTVLSVEQLIALVKASGYFGEDIHTITLDEMNNDIHIFYKGEPVDCDHKKVYHTKGMKKDYHPWKCDVCDVEGIDSFIEPTHFTSVNGTMSAEEWDALYGDDPDYDEYDYDDHDDLEDL